ncbi:MAG: two-component system activity regulator YycH [Aerococcus sp.]|nr:two-component system activity regulator YycH [Aerococcus sp.]
MRAFWNRLVHILLGTVVVVSMLVSLLIFHPSLSLMDDLVHGSDNTMNNGPRVTEQTGEQKEEPTLADVTRPERVIASRNGVLQATANQEVLEQVMRALTAQLPDDATPNDKDKQSVSNYQTAMLNHATYIELEFPDNMDFSLLQQRADVGKYHFNRLGYVSGEPIMYLIDDDKNEVYPLTLMQPAEKIDTTFSKHRGDFYGVEQVLLNNHVAYIETEARTLATLRYMMERQSNSKLLNALFPASEEIHDYSDTQMSRYFSGGHSLLVNNNDFQSEYREEFEDSKQAPSLVDAYKYLQRIQPANETWLFTDNDQEHATCTFRRYIDGIPVFGDHFVSRINLSKPRENTIQMQFSALSAQTPVTDLATEKTLPDGKTVLNALNEQGYDNNAIQALKIGYYWQSSAKSNRLIDLDPQWMVKVNGSYYALDALIDLSAYPALKPITQNIAKDTPLEQDDNDLTQAALTAQNAAMQTQAMAMGTFLSHLIGKGGMTNGF